MLSLGLSLIFSLSLVVTSLPLLGATSNKNPDIIHVDGPLANVSYAIGYNIQIRVSIMNVIANGFVILLNFKSGSFDLAESTTIYNAKLTEDPNNKLSNVTKNNATWNLTYSFKLNQTLMNITLDCQFRIMPSSKNSTSCGSRFFNVSHTYCQRTTVNSNLIASIQGTFGDIASMNCSREAVLYFGGIKAQEKYEVMCGKYAEWTDISNLSCWFAPSVNLSAPSVYSAGNFSAFSCILTPGYPNDSRLWLQIEGQEEKHISNGTVEILMEPKYNNATVYCTALNSYLKDNNMTAVMSNHRVIDVKFPTQWVDVPCISSTAETNYSIGFYSNPQTTQLYVLIKTNGSTTTNGSEVRVNGTISDRKLKTYKFGCLIQNFTAVFKVTSGSEAFFVASSLNKSEYFRIPGCQESTTPRPIISTTAFKTTATDGTSKTTINGRKDSGGGNGSILWMIVGIVAGCVVLICIMILVYVKCWKGRRQGCQPGVNQDQPNNVRQDQPNILYGEVAGAGVEVGEIRQEVANELYESRGNLQAMNGHDGNSASNGNNVENDPSSLYSVVDKKRSRNAGASKEVELPVTSVA